MLVSAWITRLMFSHCGAPLLVGAPLGLEEVGVAPKISPGSLGSSHFFLVRVRLWGVGVAETRGLHGEEGGTGAFLREEAERARGLRCSLSSSGLLCGDLMVPLREERGDGWSH